MDETSKPNMKFLHERQINGYIPDNQFRSRDPKFDHQKAKYGKRHQNKTSDWKNSLPASEFRFDPVKRTCHCPKKHRCMQNPESADHRNGSGRQASFTVADKRAPNYTDWMKHRVDSEEGKAIYSHRMSVVEPVFANIGTNKRLNRFSLRGKNEGAGPMAAILLGAQH